MKGETMEWWLPNPSDQDHVVQDLPLNTKASQRKTFDLLQLKALTGLRGKFIGLAKKSQRQKFQNKKIGPDISLVKSLGAF